MLYGDIPCKSISGPGVPQWTLWPPPHSLSPRAWQPPLRTNPNIAKMCNFGSDCSQLGSHLWKTSLRVSTPSLWVALKLTTLLELHCRYTYVQSYSLLTPMVLCWLVSSLWTGLVADADHCHSQALIKCLHLTVKALPLLLCPQPQLPGLLPSLSSQPALSLAAAAPDCSNSNSLVI